MKVGSRRSETDYRIAKLIGLTQKRGSPGREGPRRLMDHNIFVSRLLRINHTADSGQFTVC